MSTYCIPQGTILSSYVCVSISLQPYGQQPPWLLCPWDFAGKNTGVDCHFLLKGIFLTQGSNPHLLCLLHWQAGSLPLAPPGKHKYKKDWLRDVLCSNVFFRKIFEIIKKSSCTFISSLTLIFQTLLYTCSLDGYPTVLSLFDLLLPMREQQISWRYRFKEATVCFHYHS